MTESEKKEMWEQDSIEDYLRKMNTHLVVSFPFVRK